MPSYSVYVIGPTSINPISVKADKIPDLEGDTGGRPEYVEIGGSMFRRALIAGVVKQDE